MVHVSIVGINGFPNSSRYSEYLPLAPFHHLCEKRLVIKLTSQNVEMFI